MDEPGAGCDTQLAAEENSEESGEVTQAAEKWGIPDLMHVQVPCRRHEVPVQTEGADRKTNIARGLGEGRWKHAYPVA